MDDILDEIFDNESHSQGEAGAAPEQTLDPHTIGDDDAFETDDSPETGLEESTENADDEGAEEQESIDDQPEEEKAIPVWEEEKANLQKRVADNQASYQREHQERLRLEREKAELEAKLKAKLEEKSDDEDDWLEDDDSEFADLKREVEELRKEREQERVLREQEAAYRAWEEASAPIREKYTDFDEMVEKTAAAFESDMQIKQEFEDGGRTPELAYKIGQKLAKRELMAEPDKYEAYLREKWEKESQEKQKSVASQLSDIDGASTPPMKHEKLKDNVGLLDSIFS